MNLKENDVLVLRNGKRIHYTHLGNEGYVLKHFYNENLECITNDDYSVVGVYRPQYEVIFERDTNEKKRGR